MCIVRLVAFLTEASEVWQLYLLLFICHLRELVINVFVR